ncbi:hypothetical protein F5Y14DRAFT_436673 [Nemania sp. NC0429]|nr:hypothetical protein F5Y14DRAFT_436673 [Nemania sp. NC0429]
MILDRTDRILSLPDNLQTSVRDVFGDTYKTQVSVLIGIAAAQVFCVLTAVATIFLTK